jgi:hypothetical protein
MLDETEKRAHHVDELLDTLKQESAPNYAADGGWLWRRTARFLRSLSG